MTNVDFTEVNELCKYKEVLKRYSNPKELLDTIIDYMSFDEELEILKSIALDWGLINDEGDIIV